MLHPDLAKLQEQYNAVLDEYEAGHLSYEQALTAVGAMSAIDGAGYVWVIDTASGAFLRAAPGEQPMEADAAEFVPARIPARGSTPWASQQDLLRPPARPGQQRPEMPSAVYEDLPYESDGFDEDEPAPRRRGQRAGGGRAKVPKLGGSPGRFSVPPVIAANKRLVAVAAFAAVFLVLVLFNNGDNQPAVTDSLPSSASTVPSATDAPAVTDAPVTTEAPTSTSAPAPTSAPDPSAPTPTPAEMDEVLRRIATADQAEVLTLVVSETAPEATYQRRIMATARYAGYAAVGLVMRAGDATLDPTTGQVTATISLVDLVTGDVVATAPANWVRGADSAWRLVTHVDFVPTA